MSVLLDCCVEKLQNQNIDCKVITYLHFKIITPIHHQGQISSRGVEGVGFPTDQVRLFQQLMLRFAFAHLGLLDSIKSGKFAIHL